MRKTLLIALNILTRTARDRKVLLLLVAMPLILTGILGTALRFMMDTGRMDPFPVLLINLDVPVVNAEGHTTHLGKLLAEQVLRGDAVASHLKVKEVTFTRGAIADVAAGKAVALVYVPPGFTEEVQAGRPTEVQVFGDPGQPTQVEIVTQVVRGFTEELISTQTRNQMLTAEQRKSLVVQKVAYEQPKVDLVTPGAKPVSSMQYYAAAMAAMFMVMTCLARAKEIIVERDQGTLSRVLISPTGKAPLLAGLILGNAIVAFAQFIILMIGSRLLFGVNWGNWPAALLLGAAFAIAAAGLGSVAAGLLRDSRAVDAAVGIVGAIFSMLSGGMFPIYAFNGVLKGIAQAIPNYWALQGFLDLMAGFSLSYLWTPVAILLGMGLITGAFGTWRLASR